MKNILRLGSVLILLLLQWACVMHTAESPPPKMQIQHNKRTLCVLYLKAMQDGPEPNLLITDGVCPDIVEDL